MIDPARLWRRLRRRLWATPQDERDLDDEIRFHLSEEVRLRIDRGMDPREADTTARREFGNVVRVKEVARDMARWRSLATLGQDLRFGLRLLRRSKVFAFFSIASLALGIGATTTIFSLLNAIVLRQLPVEDPDRLVALSFSAGHNRPNNYLTYPLFDRLRGAATSIDGLFAWTTRPRVNATIDGKPEIVSTLFASGAYHATLGVQPALGRVLTSADDRPGTANAVVISYNYWRRRFNGSASVVGTPVRLGDHAYTIVGVEARGFTGTNLGSAPEFTLPLHASTHGSSGPQPWDQPTWTWIEVMGRLKRGVAREQAAQELTTIFRGMSADIPAPAGAPPSSIFLEDGGGGGQSALRFNYERRLRLMMLLLAAAVLLASLNVATLILARAESRRDEVTMRTALGASRGRVVRQMLTESALIAAIGGGLGVLLAWWASQVLLRTAVRDTADIVIDLTPDARVLAFAMATCIITCLFFGLLPALRATDRLHIGSRHEVGSRRRRWLERSLVASQTAVSLVLLVFMVLFVRSLNNLWTRDPGYMRSNVMLFSTDAPLAGKKGDEIRRTYRALLDSLQAIPGVRNASMSAVAPVSTTAYWVNGVGRLGSRELTGSERIRAATNLLSPGYFAVMGIPLVAGRDFEPSDDDKAPKVVIVSERLASKFAGHAVGQTIDFGGGAEVIGVAKDSRYANVKEAPRDVVYAPIFQNVGALNRNAPTFEVRYEGPGEGLRHSIRAAVAEVDPALTVFSLNTLEGYTRESLSQERLMALASSYVGVFALLLAAIGLYGLMAYAVTERTPEIGLRMALGSSPAQIRSMVLKGGAGTVLAGIIVGFGAALWLVRYAQGQIVDLQPMDPASFATATVVVALAAAGAAWLPARRASRIDPIVALRHE
jgi:predicted permease